ncbi:amino acid/polyamine transporter I [Phialemonium atrogriseum]|uniref:Amino acid/polyamine transporter I n=1 Tax=Phialemonium atrogriseum TaxID=1093897 RepID=A0AAJ0FDJ6_9PEZI|nr:amino acid/polyamine transporter I [Phialemonium atrogriseum]KAK1763317.1 amino acid/polyamine transporter I [Phialemonium atrogriseum]
MQAKMDDRIARTRSGVTDCGDSEMGKGKVENIEDNILMAQGHIPVLNRTFNILGTLGLGFSITNSWLSYASCFGQSMIYGGPQTTVFGLIVACAAQWLITLGLAEEASAFPSSGGQYHFTSVLAPQRFRRFAAFAVGVLSIVGWWVITCSGISNNVQSILGMVTFANSDYEAKQWHSYLLYVALIGITLIPIFTIPQRHLGKWTQLCLALSILGFIVVTVVILAMCDEFNPASTLLRFDGNSGWPKGVAWLMSIGNSMYAFASLDAVIHVAEEMHHPGKEIPRVMNLTMIIGLLTSLPFIIAMMFVIKDIDAVRSAPLPSLEAFYQATGSRTTALALQGILTILFFTCMPSQWITCGRLTWAFSRDNGLPLSKYWTHIHTKLQFPVRTTMLSVGVCVVYGLLYIASSQAFNSIITAAVLGVNISYVVPQAITLFHGRESRLPTRPFNLGRFGYICNAWSLAWITLIGVFICFPNELPVAASSMNYVSVVLGFVCVLLFALWWFVRKQFSGPQIDREMLNLQYEVET